MAFPAVASSVNTTTTSNSTSHTLTYPGSIASGDLLLAFGALDGTPTVSGWPTGWNEIIDRANAAVAMFWAYKFADGTESGNFTLTSSASEQGSFYVIRITGAHASTAPASTSATGVSNGLNCGPLNPADWDIEDTLWLGLGAVDTSRTITVWPSNSPDNRNSSPSGGAGGATAAFCSGESATSFYNPSSTTWAISSNDEWIAAAIAVRPAAAPVAGKAIPRFNRAPRFFRRSF
jgi:hypothetical protein